MALSIDARTAFRYPSELQQLAQAILDADPDDENDWIEWKSQVDLSTPQAMSMIAQNVLAFANRMPSVAMRNAQGNAYLFLGIEPGQVAGIATVDLSDLSTRLTPYIDPRIIWRVEYTLFDEKTVAVVIVDPPMEGAPIYTLRRQDQRGRPPGVVFVRRQGASHQAGPHDIEILTTRATSNRSLGVELSVELPLEVSPDIDPVVKSLVSQRRELLRKARHPAVSASQEGDEGVTRRAQEMMDAAELHVWRDETIDNRTLDQYLAEIDAYCEELVGSLNGRVTRRHLHDRSQNLRLRARTVSDRHASSVRLRLTIRGPVRPWQDDWLLQLYLRPEGHGLPMVPEPFGTPGALLYYLDRDTGMGGGATRSEPARVHLGWNALEVPGGSEVQFDEFDVRAGLGELLPPVYMRVDGAAGDVVSLSWEMTSANTQGFLRGSMEFPLAESTFDVEAACDIDNIFE